MAWEVKYLPENSIIEVIYSDFVTTSDVQQAVQERVSLQNETNSNIVLVDTKKANNTDVSIVNLFDLPSKLFIDEKANRNTKMSLVLSGCEKVNDLCRFWETACLNLGWRVKIFNDRDEALAWLLSSEYQ